MTMMATAVIGSAVIGVVGSSIAAGQQADASQAATAAQQQMYQQTAANEAPYVQSGNMATAQLNYLLGIGPDPNTVQQPVNNYGGYGSGNISGNEFTGMSAGQGMGGGYATNGRSQSGVNTSMGGYGSLLTPFNASMMKQYDPGYQFQMQQGQQGVLNGDASSAGALSGAAQKDLMGFNQGYANSAYNNAFNQYQTQQGNIYQRLGGMAQMGQSAASNQATGASSFANGIGQSMTNTGNAQAGGTVGMANAASSIGSLAWLQGGGGGGTPAGPSTVVSSGDYGLAPGYGINLPTGTPSDRRLKQDIEKIGSLPSGLPLYRYRYIANPSEFHVGVMADEAEVLFPDAVFKMDNGFKAVKYWMIQ